MKKKLLIILSSIIFLGFVVYGVAGFYVAYSILKIDHTCGSVSYTHLRAHETVLDLVCRLLLEK